MLQKLETGTHRLHGGGHHQNYLLAGGIQSGWHSIHADEIRRSQNGITKVQSSDLTRGAEAHRSVPAGGESQHPEQGVGQFTGHPVSVTLDQGVDIEQFAGRVLCWEVVPLWTVAHHPVALHPVQVHRVTLDPDLSTLQVRLAHQKF